MVHVDPAEPGASVPGLRFTRHGRRTEKLQSGLFGMLSKTSIAQQDANRKREIKAKVSKLARIRARYSSPLWRFFPPGNFMTLFDIHFSSTWTSANGPAHSLRYPRRLCLPGSRCGHTPRTKREAKLQTSDSPQRQQAYDIFQPFRGGFHFEDVFALSFEGSAVGFFEPFFRS